MANNNIPFRFGNRKLPKTTMIFNMTSAGDCPSKAMGLCKQHKICYARKAERLYPQVLPYRRRQAKYWDTHTAEKISTDILNKLKRKKNNVDKFRYNEAGDFRTRADIEKLHHIAKTLKKHGIITYGYTARTDLDFRGVSFVVLGSGFKAKNGQTTVINKNEDIPKHYIECPGSCKQCSLCATKKSNIAFRKH